MRQERGLCCVVVLEPVERISAWVAFQGEVSMYVFKSQVHAALPRGAPGSPALVPQPALSQPPTCGEAAQASVL